MKAKVVSLLLLCSVLQPLVSAAQVPPVGVTQEESAAATRTVQVRYAVQQLGVGRNVKVALVSGESLVGTILSTDERTFALATRAGGPVTVQFDRVVSVRKTGLSIWWKVAIYSGVAFAGVMAVLGAMFHE